MWYLILLAIAYLAVNFFLWHRVVRMLRNVHGFFGKKWVVVIFSVIYFFLFSSVASWTLFDDPSWVAALKFINNVWIGVFIYAILFVAAAEAVTFVLWLAKKMRKDYPGYRRYIVARGSIVIALVLCFSLYGVFHYPDTKVENYSVTIDKHTETADSMRIVLVADTHLGYSVGNDMMERMVEEINDQDPDMVVFAGDIVDNDYYALEDADKIAETLSGIESRYGVYGCYGNHDVEERLIGGFTVAGGKNAKVQPEVDQFVEKSGIELLEDETAVVAGDITIIGRKDASKPNRAGAGGRESIEELMAGVDKAGPVICIDHQPSELEEKAKAGVDLDLGGHTHDGQIFPGNLLIGLFWENACGMKKVDDMYSVVTSGVGVWGPAMRVGTDSEIVVVDVSFGQ